MKTSLVSVAALTVFVVLAAIAGVVFSQMEESPPPAQPKKDHIVATPAPAETLAGAIENVVKPSQAGDEQQKMVADLLRSQPAPPSRLDHFASTLNNPTLNFKGWHLQILETKAAEGVTTVKVRANVRITTREGQAAMITDFLDETYELTGQTVKLLKAEPPVGPYIKAIITF